MAKFLGALNEHVTRMARRATKPEMRLVRRAAAQHRRDIAALKRLTSSLLRRLDLLERAGKRMGIVTPSAPVTEAARFSASGVKSHRVKLGLSAKNYGKLIGVSGLSVYNWEAKKSRPRQAQLARLVAIRGLGKREALHRLEHGR